MGGDRHGDGANVHPTPAALLSGSLTPYIAGYAPQMSLLASTSAGSRPSSIDLPIEKFDSCLIRMPAIHDAATRRLVSHGNRTACCCIAASASARSMAGTCSRRWAMTS